MTLRAWIQRDLRQTAQRNRVGEYDLHEIFKELYGAAGKIYEALNAVAEFAPVYMTGASNNITAEHWHKNLLIQSSVNASLFLSEAVSEELPVGAFMVIGQQGAGTVTLVPQGAVVINSLSGLSTLGQWSELFLAKINTLTWVLFGHGPVVNPHAGALIRVHNTYASTVAHYDFQDPSSDADMLVDSVGGFNLTNTQSGAAIVTGVSPSAFQASRVGPLSFLLSTSRIRHNVAGTALYLQSAMTFATLIVFPYAAYVATTIVKYGLSGQNHQYMLETLTTSELQYSHQRGAGVTESYKWKVLPPTGEVTHVAFTRTAGGVIQFWVNGRKAGPASGALTMPDGGATALLHFGVDSGGGGAVNTPYLASARIDNAVLSDETLRGDYNWTLGDYYGYVV